MVHVQQRYYVAILVIIQGNANFFEQQLDIKTRRLLVDLVVDHDLERLSWVLKSIDVKVLLYPLPRQV